MKVGLFLSLFSPPVRIETYRQAISIVGSEKATKPCSSPRAESLTDPLDLLDTFNAAEAIVESDAEQCSLRCHLGELSNFDRIGSQPYVKVSSALALSRASPSPDFLHHRNTRCRKR
jgi:hypothetical protein